MLQLYLNYKLKSVAHLPWRQMSYKFLNTIIDDLFAFVIKMPTLHRLSVFRDDLVFLVYLYQRWAYRVDKRRANEFGWDVRLVCKRMPWQSLTAQCCRNMLLHAGLHCSPLCCTLQFCYIGSGCCVATASEHTQAEPCQHTCLASVQRRAGIFQLHEHQAGSRTIS